LRNSLTVIWLKLCDIIGNGLFRPVLGDVKGHERGGPEIAAMEIQDANVLSYPLGEAFADPDLVRYPHGIPVDHNPSGILANLGVFFKDHHLCVSAELEGCRIDFC